MMMITNSSKLATLDTAVAAICADPFSPPLWLRGGHRQSVLGSLWQRQSLTGAPSIWIESEQGIRLLCHVYSGDRGKPKATLLVVHGLAGSSDSGPVVDLVRNGRRHGLDVVCMNVRGCSATQPASPALYHSNYHQDVSAVVRYLIEKEGVSNLVLVGFSMGGNLVLNYLGQSGEAVPHEISGAVVICPVIDVSHCISLLDERPTNRLYRYFFLQELRQSYLRLSRLDPLRFPPERMRDVSTMRAFDFVATAKDAGFDDVEEFYSWVSSIQRLPHIVVPTVVLHAADDPLVVLTAATRDLIRATLWIRLVEMKHGGHCSFLERSSSKRPDGRWAADQVARFAKAVCGLVST